jgi:GT2 family glycosyltransferase
LLYTSHNRREFVEATFPALIANTNWERVAHLYVLDDLSEDGTAEFLCSEVAEFYDRTGMKTDCISDRFGGPVAAMNYALDHGDSDVLVKVDNDLLVCPGWLDALLDVLERSPDLDVLGFEAGFGDGLAPASAPRAYREASHCGGVGAFRVRAFARHRPKQHDRFFGLTEHMRHHARCGWLTPDLPCVLLDHLPFEPWISLTQEYRARGWSRTWPVYPESMAEYWADLAVA